MLKEVMKNVSFICASMHVYKHRGEIQSRRKCLGKKLVHFKIKELLLRLFNNIHSKNKLMLFRTE
jgi:hypothetical protein